MSKRSNCECERGGSFPVFGEGFSRRQFLRVSGTGLVASFFTPVLNARLLSEATAVSPLLHKTAKNCIFIFLAGAPSHIDTWDLKEGTWTPAADFAPTSYGAMRFPQRLMPKTADHLNDLAIIRSGLSWAAVHQLAQVWTQISRNPTSANGIAPHIGAVAALESQLTRKETDILPGFVSINQVLAGSGYLPAKYAPFPVTPNASGLTSLAHPDGAARGGERWNLLTSTDADRVTGNLGRNASDMATFYDQAKVLIDSPDANRIFSYSPEDYAKYGSTQFGGSLLVARNLVASNQGTRFVQVTMGGWDHHSDIYAKAGSSIFTNMATFDPAFGALLDDLRARDGSVAGKTLLDETLVVILGEFGRTVGALNAQGGRDHFLRMSVVFAGGGVKGGTVIGETDAAGSGVKEFGWAGQRDVRPEDVTASIYSALGIDYTTVRRDDPLNRGFEYVPFAKDGTYGPVNELFSDPAPRA